MRLTLRTPTYSARSNHTVCGPCPANRKHAAAAGIYETLKRCALISKTAGGIGLSVNSIRANNSYISGTNGQSNGLVPMLRVR